MRLIDHLKALGWSNRAAREAMQSGKVLWRGIPTADAAREIDPAEVQVEPNAPRIVVGRDPFIRFRDAHLVVVWKPAGLLSVPAPGRRESHVLEFVGKRFGKAFAVHRLDEDTSGLILVALDERTQSALKDQFERHGVDRRYLAICAGAVPRELRVESTLVRDRGDGLRGSGAGGKPAITHFFLRERLSGSSLVEARLETGRTHQVRIHLSERGHPILGDPLYGGPGVARRAPRLALHAFFLQFEHPSGGKHTFEVPLADDIEALRRNLRPP